MTWLIVGLIVFIGAHSVRIFADGWRSRTIACIGENKWKGIYSLISIAGFALIAVGYGQARIESAVLYDPPAFTRHIASVLMLVSFVLVAAAYVPGNKIKATVGHPMIAGVKVWAFAHLLSNGRVEDVILFGAFLAWAIVDFVASRKRDRPAGVSYPPGNGPRTTVTVVTGAVVWAVFAFWLHQYLIGVAPFA